MAELTQNPNEAAASAMPPTAGRRSLLSRLIVFLFVVMVIVVECAVAYLYVPSTNETVAMAGVRPAAVEAKNTPAKDNAPAQEESASQVEVDMGEFSVTAFQPASNTTLRIDFRLWGTVRQEEQKEFARLMEETKHRFRDQVITTMRSAEITDLTDAGLGLIKRKVMDKTNRTFGKPILQAVIFSDFSFIEQ
jgi:flagellar basal body-associated protein FliL